MTSWKHIRPFLGTLAVLAALLLPYAPSPAIAQQSGPFYEDSANPAAHEACPPPQALIDRYKAVVTKVSGPATSSMISKNLIAITADNKDLIWENGVPGSRVLVATYGTAPNPLPSPLPNPNYNLTRTKWVTVVPELYNFFTDKPFSALRLEQLLGLPPCYGNTTIIEYWADPKDLVRPSPDPEIIDHEAALDFPTATENPKAGKYLIFDTSATFFDEYDCNPPGSFNCNYNDYPTWFNNRKSNVYFNADYQKTWPWSRLGYTYDWGRPNNPIGGSEFMLVGSVPGGGGITVGLESITPAKDYFTYGPLAKPRLTVLKSGQGTLTSAPQGIHCGVYCPSASMLFRKYTNVVLTAKAATGYSFSGWSGACSGSALTCTVPMASDQIVEGTFVQGP
jgi:hypothetical protein